MKVTFWTMYEILERRCYFYAFGTWNIIIGLLWILWSANWDREMSYVFSMCAFCLCITSFDVRRIRCTGFLRHFSFSQYSTPFLYFLAFYAIFLFPAFYATFLVPGHPGFLRHFSCPRLFMPLFFSRLFTPLFLLPALHATFLFPGFLRPFSCSRLSASLFLLPAFYITFLVPGFFESLVSFPAFHASFLFPSILRHF